MINDQVDDAMYASIITSTITLRSYRYVAMYPFVPVMYCAPSVARSCHAANSPIRHPPFDRHSGKVAKPCPNDTAGPHESFIVIVGTSLSHGRPEQPTMIVSVIRTVHSPLTGPARYCQAVPGRVVSFVFGTVDQVPPTIALYCTPADGFRPADGCSAKTQGSAKCFGCVRLGTWGC
jgi:hypothetical protein